MVVPASASTALSATCLQVLLTAHAHLEHCAARLAQQQHLVEEGEDAVSGLVDHCHNVHAQVRHPAHMASIFTDGPV